ncbi:GNAT family N-acetyltransferase [Chitinophaga pendula]|uniref:GNAT family N-acetyltransferase n=1 Tax=Chitinophaga TaxID=79328 RepID=UPI000BAEB9D8|nr:MULTISPECIES: GNAT family N-acetyltransferase [Chitinophaga]ASZ11698.1 GNAT family N-acetyltransferase [Chitinophaga sp. MD30]UCJ05286.1 GNAT family N-acetyltransferase [Chitinophaga pendula]
MLHVKAAAITDISTIQALADKIWPPTYAAILTPEQITYMMDMMYSTSSLQDQLTVKGHHYLILADDQQPIGYASYSTTSETQVFKLHKIYLDPSQQGKGIGKFLLNAVADQVRAADGTVLELDVNRHNKALQFYQSQGFNITGEKDTDIGRGYLMNDYILRKTLV